MEMYGNVRTSHSIPRPVEQMLTLKKHVVSPHVACCITFYQWLRKHLVNKTDRNLGPTHSPCMQWEPWDFMGFHGPNESNMVIRMDKNG